MKLCLTKYHGGSSYYIPWLLEQMPDRYWQRPYAETHGGAFNLGLNKEPSDIELYNDKDPSIYWIFRHLKETPEPMIKELQETQYNKEQFEHSLQMVLSANTYLKAVHGLIIRRFSRGGLGKHYASSNRVRRGCANGDEGSYKYWAENILPKVAARIRDVKFYNEDAIEFIKKRDGYGVTLFVDPPFLPSTRVTKKVYNFEMTYEEHELLLKVLVDCLSNVMLLGYDNDLYNSVLTGWHKSTKDIANHSGQGKTKERRTICLWRNY